MSLPPSLRVLERGWLSANNVVFLDGDEATVVDTGYVTHAAQTVELVRHALDGQDIQDHLAAGKLPTRLAMTFDDRVSFILTEKMEIKRVAFLNGVINDPGRKANEKSAEEELAEAIRAQAAAAPEAKP
jgi:DNA recombination-dependent growth factor C